MSTAAFAGQRLWWRWPKSRRKRQGQALLPLEPREDETELLARPFSCWDLPVRELFPDYHRLHRGGVERYINELVRLISAIGADEREPEFVLGFPVECLREEHVVDVVHHVRGYVFFELVVAEALEHQVRRRGLTEPARRVYDVAAVNRAERFEFGFDLVLQQETIQGEADARVIARLDGLVLRAHPPSLPFDQRCWTPPNGIHGSRE